MNIPDIKIEDLVIETYRSHGILNTRDNGVRVTHKPSGFKASSDSEKSLIKNKEKCLKIIITKINLQGR